MKMSDKSLLTIQTSQIRNSWSINGAMGVDMNSQMFADHLTVDGIYSEDYCSFLYSDKSLV